MKAETIALIREWVLTCGAAAGVDPADTQLLSGSIGARESRVELHVAFEGLAQMETFFSNIPVDEHRDFNQKFQAVVVDGSPRWEVFQIMPAAAPVDQQLIMLSEDESREAIENLGGAPAGPALDWKGDPIVMNPGDKLPFNFI